MRRWTFDASPLIALGKAGLLDLPERLGAEVVVPDAVAAEVAAGDAGDPARVRLQSGPVVPSVPVRALRVVAAWDLGAGESAVISYVLDHPGADAVLDDAPARTCAKALGVRVRGTLGPLVLAKREGVIPAVRPPIDALLGAGYHLGSALVAAVVAEAGEPGRGTGS